VFGTLGMPELILIFVVALLLFGPRKMPQIGRSIGRALGEFRRASNEFKRTIEDEVAAEDVRDVKKDLDDLRDVGRDFSNLRKSFDKPVDSVVRKVLDPGEEPGADDGKPEEKSSS
jgi:TatA/E family protein of Tat protein translocase